MWCMELSSRCCAEMNIHIDLRRGSQRISVVSSRKSSHLYSILWNTASYGANEGEMGFISIDLGYTKLFCIPEVHQCSSRFVTVFLGTLWCSIKKIEAPYMFDWEYGIALHAMQGNRASFPSEGEVSYDF